MNSYTGLVFPFLALSLLGFLSPHTLLPMEGYSLVSEAKMMGFSLSLDTFIEHHYENGIDGGKAVRHKKRNKVGEVYFCVVYVSMFNSLLQSILFTLQNPEGVHLYIFPRYFIFNLWESSAVET